MANFTYVTLVPFGGTPVHLADQTGAPFATTGTGALVFANGPVITNPVFTGPTNLPAGSAAIPSLTFGDVASGLYSSGTGNTSLAAAGMQVLSVTPAGISVTGNVTYSGSLVGAFASPLNTRGDLYYFSGSGNARLPLGANGTVLGSNGTDAVWVAAGAGTVSSVTAGTGLTAAPNPITSVGTISIAATAVTLGSYGSATQSPTYTVNAQGQLTAAANVTITPAVGSITGLGTGVAAALVTNVSAPGAFVVNGGVLGTPSSGTLTNATGLPISTGLTGAGTGVLTALGVNVGSAGAPVLFNGAGGTPASLVLTNATGLPAASVLAGALASGMTATTQSANDNSTKLATTAYSDRVLSNLVIRVQSFTSSGTYTPNANLVSGYVVGIGGGGGGGGSASTSASVAQGFPGGSSGNQVTTFFVASQVTPTVSVTVGAGGTAGTGAGGSGGDTIFGSLLTAKGGGGSNGTTNGPGGVPNAVGNVGTVVQLGQPGQPGYQITTSGSTIAWCPNGGGSGGGTAAGNNSIGNGAAGAANSGGGGSGGSQNGVASALNGGAGGTGFLYVVEFCTH